MRILLTASVLIIPLIGGPTEVRAQASRSTGTGQQGTFGSRSLGSGLSAGSRSFGQNPMSRLGSGSNAAANVGQLNSSARFVRGNRRPGEFVGSDVQELREFVGAVQAGSGTGQASQGPTGPSRSGTANQPSGSRGRGGRRAATQVRNSLSVGFSFPATAPAQASKLLVARIEKSQRIRSLSPVQVELHSGTATLRGTVATAHDRELAGILARLEPGIYQVNNELVVAELPPGSAPSEPVAPPE